MRRGDASYVRTRIDAFSSRHTAVKLIVVVEDDTDVRTYVVEALTELKYNVLQAPNGDAALKRAMAL